ncbi:hypothetical protein [Enterococcus dispar]
MAKKEALIKAEIAKLKALMEEVPRSSVKVVEGLIERIAFMNVTLSELESDMNKNGTIEYFKNGSQEFYKESATAKTYNTMVNRYTAAVKELLRLVTEYDKNLEDVQSLAEFNSFLSERE